MPPQDPQQTQQPQAPEAYQAYQATQTYPVPQPQSQEEQDQLLVSELPPPGASRSGMSRRSMVLRAAASVGAVGLAAAGGASATFAVTRPRAQALAANEAKPAVMAAMPPNAMEGPLVVYISDTTTGQLDVFAGDGQVRLKNRALVTELLRALQ